MSRTVGVLFALLVVVGIGRPDSVCRGEDPLPMLEKISVTSSLDKTPQTSLLWAPESAREQPTPLLIWLHSWSADYRQEASLEYQKQAVRRGMDFVVAQFSRTQQTPRGMWIEIGTDRHHRCDELCRTALQGRLAACLLGRCLRRRSYDAVDGWILSAAFLSGFGLGGHYGCGSVVPGSSPCRQALEVRARHSGCLRWKPGESQEIDADYRARSPIHFLHQVGDLHVDIAAGVKDGHTGSVPIAHSLNAFNRIATTNGDDGVSDDEAEQLWTAQKLTTPQASDQVTDETYGREIILRRKSGNARVTIFQGGHEGLPEACCAWLAKQRRATTE